MAWKILHAARHPLHHCWARAPPPPSQPDGAWPVSFSTWPTSSLHRQEPSWAGAVHQSLWTAFGGTSPPSQHQLLPPISLEAQESALARALKQTS